MLEITKSESYAEETRELERNKTQQKKSSLNKMKGKWECQECQKIKKAVMSGS